MPGDAASIRDARPHVVIIGGGFGGLNAAQRLARSPVRVTIVDRRNHHVFQPLLYQIATAALSPANIAAPIRHILSRQKNATVLLADVKSIDASRRVVQLDQGELAYDYLVVAAGATHSYFGHPEWAANAPGLKTIEDAIEIRRRFLIAFERAERSASVDERRRELTFVVVGGGATGVEMAGSMIEIARHAIPRDFRHIDTTTARVILIEASPRLLATYPESLSARAKRDLESLGVEVRLHSRVTSIDAHGVNIGDERIEAGSVIWAAGVLASSLGVSLRDTAGATLDHNGRVVVKPDLTIEGHPEIFVVGDLAAAKLHPGETGERGEKLVPGVAQGAIQGGAFAARAIDARVRRRENSARPLVFRYREKGELATIGRSKAVATIGRFKFAGLPAWLLWAGLHIFYLIDFRNRLIVMLEWFWLYVAFDRGARLITGERASDQPTPAKP
jgi:NADH dehydrogenase